MTPNSEADQTRPTGTRWSVHFLFGQKAWGERASQWRWIGKGEISLDRHFLNIDGRKHRYFRTAANRMCGWAFIKFAMSLRQDVSQSILPPRRPS